MNKLEFSLLTNFYKSFGNGISLVAISELSIDDSIRYEEKLKNKDVKIKEFETDSDRRITNLEMMISEMAKRLEAKS